MSLYPVLLSNLSSTISLWWFTLQSLELFKNWSYKHNCSGSTAFKSQRVGYQSNQKLTASPSVSKKSTQFINSFLRYSNFEGLMNKKVHGHFWPCAKIIESIFSFPEFRPARKKSFSSSVHSWDTDKTGHTHFWPCPPKDFPINF